MRQSLNMLIRDSKAELADPKVTALLVVDVQNDFTSPEGAMARGGMNMSSLASLPERVNEVVELGRSAGVTIAWIHNTTLPDGLGESPAWHKFKTNTSNLHQYTIEGEWGWELSEPLQRRGNEVVLRKSRSSAFVRTPLEGILRSNGIECVVLVGCMTDGCVESTIRNAAHFDFYASIVPEACASSRDEWHENAIQHMKPRYGSYTISELQSLWG